MLKGKIETLCMLVAIALVDSNLQREHLLPSEKAFGYKLKMDALSVQGKKQI